MTTIFEILRPYVGEAQRMEQIEAQDSNMYIEAANNACRRCLDNDKVEGSEHCAACARDLLRGYEALSLAGRCANGAERDSGKLYHAVPLKEIAALCGAKPGRRSAGWSSYPAKDVTCPRCLRKLQVVK